MRKTDDITPEERLAMWAVEQALEIGKASQANTKTIEIAKQLYDFVVKAGQEALT